MGNPDQIATEALDTAIELSPVNIISHSLSQNASAGPSSAYPPSFAESQFHIILRRQSLRHRHSGIKSSTAPSRFNTLSNDFEFAGWGSVAYIELRDADIMKGEEMIKRGKDTPIFGPWIASAVAANEVFGSVFYAFPPVVAVAGVYSPLSLLFATLVLFLWRPIVEELTSAFPTNGANYTYLINSTSKAFALVGSALTILDYATTIVVSASTAAAYIAAETKLPFPTYVGTIIIVAFPLTVSLLGLKESARTAFAILTFHLTTMVALTLASFVAWMRLGNDQMHENWVSGQPGSVAAILKQIFYGFCLGILGLTGFECSPDYVTVVRPGDFRKVLRNIHLPTIGLYGLLMLMVIANLPLELINSGANVLSVLAEHSVGRWMRIWVVVDASIVLSAGVLTGILSACALFEKLAQDRILPQLFLRRIPATNAQAVTICVFTLFSGVLYASVGANLQIISKVFALTWLSVMTLFPVSLLLLKFNRGRLNRINGASLSLTFVTIMLCLVAFGGNIAIDPTTVGYFSAYAAVLIAFFYLTNNKVRIMRYMYWAYDQTPLLHKWRWSRRKTESLAKAYRRHRRQPVCVLAKTDEIHHLFRMITYVSKNEQTSCVKLVHLYERIEDIPSEIEANSKLLDEAFPEITVDLVFIQAQFNPAVVAAVAEKLQIPRSLMFMSCPGASFDMNITDFGTRIIAL